MSASVLVDQDRQLLERTIASIAPLDAGAMAGARARQDRLTKPAGALGRLEALSIQVAGIMADPLPAVPDKVILTMAGDHGVTAEGVSAYPQAVTRQMVANFLAGGAAINVLARHIGARVVVVDMGVVGELPDQQGLMRCKVAHGTANMAAGPAMSTGEALRSLAAGIEVVAATAAAGLSIVGMGEMGIGNTTAAAAIAAVLTGCDPAQVAGRGTGLDDARLLHKAEVIRRSLAANRPDPDDALDVLVKVGGYEIGGLAGAILAAASRRRPVVLDGFISTAAAMIAAGLAPSVRDYLIASHHSFELGHAGMLAWLGIEPLLDLDLRLGEGTGAALGISLVDAACKLLAEMATFDSAGVSTRR